MTQRAESTPSEDPGRMKIKCISCFNKHSVACMWIYQNEELIQDYNLDLPVKVPGVWCRTSDEETVVARWLY